MSFDQWQRFLDEGNFAVETVRRGLKARGINAGESIITKFGTDEDIPIYGRNGNKLFWISVKTVWSAVIGPHQMPAGYKGWMVGEVDSKQWVNPPKLVIWYSPKNKAAWGAIIPKRLSLGWLIFPDTYGRVIDKRKTKATRETHYLYPSYCVPPEKTISKDEAINFIKSKADFHFPISPHL